ncbi:MAG: penicillin acylase family protein [bacterium]
MKPQTIRNLIFLLLLILAGLIGFAIAGYLMLAWAVPPTDGYMVVDGLRDSVTVTYDRMGIPQIWADNEHDAYFAMGYQHAADRLFQMDLVRRVSLGRLSEMLGEVTLGLDIQQRRLGHGRMAQEAAGGLRLRDRERLRAYCDGINRYATSCRALPFEYRLLPVTFETWTIEDCLAILSYQTWFSNALMSNDDQYLRLYEQLGAERTSRLLPVYPPWAPVTVPEQPPHGGLSPDYHHDLTTAPSPAYLGRTGDDEHLSGSNVFQSAIASSVLENDAYPMRMTTASNAWAVGPQKSAGGKAMLASDPHLEITRLPQFWYAMGIHCESDGPNALGITTPGLPYIIMGHNGTAAWAFTVGGIDVNDYHIEQLDPNDNSRYLTPDGYQPLTTRVDTIAVAGRDQPTVVTNRWTRHGPLVNEGDESSGTLYSLHWVGYDVDLAGAVGAGFDLHGVTDFDSFRRVVTNLGALDASWLYADSAGNIGYQLGTPIAIRPPLVAALPGEGWLAENDWQGFVPLDETPHALNPERSWLASCNNLPSRGPWIGAFAFDRITRISELLGRAGLFSPSDMWIMQMDLVDAYLPRWKNVLAQALVRLEESKPAGEVLTWDGSFDSDSRTAALMALFYLNLREVVSRNELDGVDGLLSKAAFDRLLLGPVDDAPDDEAYNESIDMAARKAVAVVADRSWGQMLSLSMSHPMGRVPILGDLLGLNRGPWPWRGSAGTLDAAFYRAHGDTSLTAVVGPSWRFVIDFADVDGATMVLPAGNSGHPMSEHFFDFFDMWRDGKRWNVPFSRERVFERAVSSLVLVPNEN